MRVVVVGLLALVLQGFSANAWAGACEGDFVNWIRGVRAEAVGLGVSETAAGALDRVRPNPKVLALDRSQKVFAQDWQTFAGRMVNAYRVKLGAGHLKDFAEVFALAERRFGVPGPVIAAFWGLETDFGAVQGDFDTLDALATLAHDCRRPGFFRPQLIAALRLLDLGYLTVADLKGAWAGELGQIQILPADYLELGTDGDGDGRVDLKASKPDVILTGARLLQHLGWRAGEPWLEEVRVPDELPWGRAGLDQRLPGHQWAAWGVRDAAGADLATEGPPASLLLPMGRKGAAFLAYPNFEVFLRWNQSLVYSTTAAYFATRLAGAPKAWLGQPEPGLSREQMQQLQGRLTALGNDGGAIDGILGAKTQVAVRREQIRLGLPADAWPTPALLGALE
jgi:lytic murein transglycosylase